MAARSGKVSTCTDRPVPRLDEVDIGVAPDTPLRVLIIDNSSEDRMIVRLALESEGYLLSEADNGERGLAAAEALSLDCILLDCYLPDLDSTEVLDALRRPDGSMPCVVAMMTGNGDGEVVASLLTSGAVGYVNKLNEAEESLRRTVRGAVERHRLIEESRRAAKRNAHLAAIVIGSVEAIISTDLNDRVTSWNPAAAGLFGYAEREALGRTTEELIVPPEMIEQRRNLYATVKSSRMASVAEGEWHRKDGTIVDVEVSVSPLFDAAGAVAGISVVFRDNTEREASKTALLQSEARLRLALRASAMGVWDWDLQDRISWSGEHHAIFGVEHFEGTRNGFSRFLHPADADRVWAAVNAALETGSLTIDFRIIRGDGEERWVANHGIVVRDSAGVPVRMLGTVRDITDRKQSEAAMHNAVRQAEQLAATRRQLAAIVESTADAVIGFDVEGRITSWNGAAEALFGYTQEEAIGQSADLLVPPCVQPLPGESERGAFDAALAGERFQRDTIRVAKDGTAIDVNVTATQIRTPEGQIFGVSAIMRDIRGRKQVEEQLRASEVRLSRILRQSPVGIVQTDAQGHMLQVNERWTEMLGYSGDELIGRSVIEVTHPSSVEATVDAVTRLAEGAPDFQIEKNYLRKDGSILRANSNVAALRDPEGNFEGLLAVVLDLTERLEAEERLRESDRRQSFLLKLNDRLRPLGDPTEIGREAALLLGEELGVDRAAYYEIQNGDYVIAADYARGVPSITGNFPVGSFGRDLRKRHNRGDPIVVPDVSITHGATKEPRFVELRIGAYIGVPLVKNSRFLAGFTVHSTMPRQWTPAEVALVQEVAERTWAAVERARSEGALRAAHDTFRQLVDRSPFGVYAVDYDFKLVQVSDGARKVFENVRPLIGRDFSEVIRVIWPEPFATEVIGRFRNTLETGEAYRAASATVEQRADIGETEAYDWKIERITLPDGRPGVVCHFYDLSERQRHDEHVQMLLREVNHRSKNMLALVQAIARQSAAAGPEEFLKRFRQRLEALAASQDLLVKNVWKAVPLRDLIHSQLAHFGNGRDAQVKLEGPPLELTAAAAQAIGMALHELATNAAKYGALSNTFGRVSIRWEVRQEGDGESRFVMHWVESGGPTVAKPSHQGFGSTVIDSMIRTTLGCEARITFAPAGIEWRIDCSTSKVIDGDYDRLVARPWDANTADAAKSVERRRVLVVEDEALIAIDIAAALSDAGWEIVGPARTVAQALALVAGIGCDAAVLDTNLGGETAEPIARELVRSGKPFVIVSGYSRDQQPPVLRSAPLIGKPLNLDLLVSEIKRCLA